MENTLKKRKKLILVGKVFSLLLLGFFFGFMFGLNQGIGACFGFAENLLNRLGIDDTLKEAILNYARGRLSG